MADPICEEAGQRDEEAQSLAPWAPLASGSWLVPGPTGHMPAIQQKEQSLLHQVLKEQSEQSNLFALGRGRSTAWATGACRKQRSSAIVKAVKTEAFQTTRAEPIKCLWEPVCVLVYPETRHP